MIGRIEHLLFNLCGLTQKESETVIWEMSRRLKDRRENHKIYCEKFDAYYDERDGSWMERRCSSKDCEFCSKRPVEHKPHKWLFIDGVKKYCGGTSK